MCFSTPDTTNNNTIVEKSRRVSSLLMPSPSRSIHNNKQQQNQHVPTQKATSLATLSKDLILVKI